MPGTASDSRHAFMHNKHVVLNCECSVSRCPQRLILIAIQVILTAPALLRVSAFIIETSVLDKICNGMSLLLAIYPYTSCLSGS